MSEGHALRVFQCQDRRAVTLLSDGLIIYHEPFRKILPCAGPRRLKVNLHPDEPGPMYRHRDMLNDAAQGHDRVPPTQRLEDPLSHTNKPSNAALAPPMPGKKFCQTVIDQGTAQELCMPQSDGTSQSYRCDTIGC